MPRLADADHHRRGPARARRDGAAALAGRRRGERDREDGRGAGRRTRACARSGTAGPTSSTRTCRRGRSCPSRSRAASGPSPTRRRCSLTCEVMYLPGNADGDGWGREVEAEIEAWIADRRRRPTRGSHCTRRRSSGRSTSRRPRSTRPIRSSRRWPGPARPPASRRRSAGLDSWFDAATFTRFADTPVDRLRAALAGVGPHDRRVRAGRRPGLVHAGARAGGRRLLRGGRMTAAPGSRRRTTPRSSPGS